MASLSDRQDSFDPFVSFSGENLTVDSTSGGVIFTVAKYVIAGTQLAKRALCTVETAQIRTSENTTVVPTSTVGTLWQVGDTFEVYGSENIKNFHAIRATGTSATLDVEYYF